MISHPLVTSCGILVAIIKLLFALETGKAQFQSLHESQPIPHVAKRFAMIKG